MNETEKRYEKTAVVTGTSKGIGYEICKVMLRDGYKVVRPGKIRGLSYRRMLENPAM